MKKATFLAISMAICLIFLNGCSKQEIKIGYAACLTGTNSELGVSGMYGAILAVEEINRAGGVKGQGLVLITKDDKGDPEHALSVDQELKDENCIAIIGHMTSDMAETTVPFANKHDILMISPTIALPSVSNTDDNFFRLIPTTMDQAKRIAEEIVKQRISHIQIVCSKENAIFAEYITEALINRLSENQVDIEILNDFQAKVNEPKFKQDVESMINSSAEALVVIASADVVAELAQTLNQRGCDKIVFLPAWSMTSDLIKRGGPTVEGFYGVNFLDVECQRTEYISFKNSYIEKFGSEPTFSAILTYESVMLLAQAMQETASYQVKDLKNAILKAETFQGLQEEISMNQFGDVNRSIYLYQIKNAHFVKVE